jgi:hypothetical protein
MFDPEELYPLALWGDAWHLSSGEVVDEERLACLFRSDCSVVFLGPQGGSFAYDVTEDGQEVVRFNSGDWGPVDAAQLLDWQQQALTLVLRAIDLM